MFARGLARRKFEYTEMLMADPGQAKKVFDN